MVLVASHSHSDLWVEEGQVSVCKPTEASQSLQPLMQTQQVANPIKCNEIPILTDWCNGMYRCKFSQNPPTGSEDRLYRGRQGCGRGCQLDPHQNRYMYPLPIQFGDIYVLFDLILYIPSTIFQLNRDGSSWVEAVLS